MQFSTDFREYRRGSLPGDFSERWTSGGYSCVEGSYIDPSHKSYLQINGSVANNSLSTRTAISWNAPEVSAYTDQEVLCLLRPINSSNNVFTSIALRGGGTATSPNVYRITIMDNGTYTVNKFIAAVNTTFYTGTKTFVIGGLYWFRFRVNGTTISAKVWNDGEDEPASWTYSGTDSTLTSGWMGFSLGATNVSRTECIYLSVGTAGDTALYPFELASSGFSGGESLLIESGTGDELLLDDTGDRLLLEDVAQGLQSITLDYPMAEWINDPETEYALTVKITYYNPVTKSFGTHWIAQNYMSTGPADYPVNTPMPGLLKNITIGERRASAYSYETGTPTPGGAGVTSGTIVISNPVVDIDTPGLLDDWLNYDFVGSYVEVRAGRVYLVPPSPSYPNGILNPHRNYEVISSGRIDKNPIRTSGQENEFNIGYTNTPGFRFSSEPHSIINTPVAKGITTGVEVMSTTGYLTIPNHAAYNVTDFTISMRVYIPTTGVAGTTHAILARRESTTVPTDRQFYIGFYQASHATLANKLFAQTYSGGVAVVNAISTRTYNLGRYIDIVFGYKPGGNWFFYADGRLVERGSITASPVTPAAPIEVCRNAPALMWCDFRMDRYIPETQAMGRFSTISEPDIYNLAMHRGDDNTGSTVTDYSATANHGTLNGTNGVDRQWVPTYLGHRELAGNHYPFSAGVFRHAPTWPIDPVRGIFRFSDRARTPGTELTILSRGVPLAAGVGYNEITTQGGAGCVDMVGAYDEPITFRLTPSAGAENPTIHAGRLCHDELLNRGVFTSYHMDRDSFIGHRQQLPFRSGFHNESAKNYNAEQFIGALIGLSGGHAQHDMHGRIAAGVYISPINPGPYGQDTLLEFIGLPNRGVSFAPTTDHNLLQDPSKRFSLVAIVKFHRVPYYDRSASSSFTYFPSGMTIIDKCGNGAGGYYLGIDGRDGSVIFGAPGVTSASTGFHYISYKYPFQPDKWYAICGTQTSTTGRAIRIVDIANPDPQAEVSETTTGALADSPNEPLKIGHGIRGSFCGSITYAIGSSLRRTGTQHLAMADGRPTILSGSPSGIHDRFFVELREGTGDYVTDSVTGLTAYIDGVRWCPRLVLDYTKQSTYSVLGERSLMEGLRSVMIGYKLNALPMTEANIASSVTGSDRLELKTRHRTVLWENLLALDNGLVGEEIAVVSSLDSDVDAEYLMNLVISRFNLDRDSGILGLKMTGTWRLSLIACGPGDEIYVKSNTMGLRDGKSLRLIGVSGIDFFGLDDRKILYTAQ